MEENLDWTEVYRPKRLEDIVGHKSIRKMLIKFRENENFPRLLMSGISGTGKTTAAVCLANTVFEHADVLELNASDERKIDTVRYDITSYAEARSPWGVPFKTVILDECESMTHPAQNALRRVMEKFSKNCKFILTCNEPLSLIPAIRSRCRPLVFKPLKVKPIIKVLKRICKEEEVEYTDKQLKNIAKDSLGDLRMAIETLQTVAEGREEIDEDLLNSLIHPYLRKQIHSMIADALNGDLDSALVTFGKAKTYLSHSSLDVYVQESLMEMDDPDYSTIEKAILANEWSKVPLTHVTSGTVLCFLARLFLNSPCRTPPKREKTKGRY